jgi:hypothetical protein
MTAEVLIIEAVIGLSRKTLLDNISHTFQLWAHKIYYKFTHVSFIFPSFLQPLRCTNKICTADTSGREKQKCRREFVRRRKCRDKQDEEFSFRTLRVDETVSDITLCTEMCYQSEYTL